MQLFKYKGYDPRGQKVDGEVGANTIEEAERRLALQEVTVISIIPAGLARRVRGASSEGGAGRRSGGRRVRDSDLAVILRDLSVMAEAGVPFVEALDAVVAAAGSPAIARSLSALKDEVVGGKSLAASMRSVPGLFPSIVSEMVRVAEEGGRLDRALASAAQYVERAAELRKKIVNAMLYPIVLTVISCLTLTVLVVFVLPRFAGIFQKMGAEIPVTTQAMLWLGETMRSHPIWMLAAIVAAAFGLRAALRSETASRALSRLFFRVPVVGELIRKLALSRALQSISTLLSSNVSLMSALEHGAKVSGNPIIQDALLTARASVEDGVAFSDSLIATRVFPPTLIQMVAVGERTGRLHSLMASTAAYMEEEVDARLKAVVSIVEPVMIVVMGGIVGLITLSVVLPIYSVIQNIK